jgi:hypothetical protein
MATTKEEKRKGLPEHSSVDLNLLGFLRNVPSIQM